MRLFCKECGCEFHTDLVGACEICPDCAAERIRATEEFLSNYNPNSEEMRRMDREFNFGSAVRDYFFIDTYPMFRKLLEWKQQGEALSDCLSRAIAQPGMPQGVFYRMSRRDIQYYMGKKGDYCYQQLWKEIRTIFLQGERRLLGETPDKLVQQFEVCYKGYCYAYLLDHHEGKEVALLTDCYHPWERGTENLLLSSLFGQSFVEENKGGKKEELRYRWYRNGQYVIINTYHAFCKYADRLGKAKDLGFNNTLFPTAERELNALFGRSGDLNSRMPGQLLSYVVFGNVIIAYRFNECGKIFVEAVV